MKVTNYLFIAFLVWAGVAFAQFSKNLEISSYVDDNLYRSPVPVSDLLTNIDLSLDFRPESSTVNFSYDGSFFLYRDANERNFSIHSLNLSFYHLFGEAEQHTYYLGVDGLVRTNKEVYNYYDYSQLYAYFNLRLDLDYIFLKAGYNFRLRNYINLPELTNYQHYLYLQFNKPFETRTTLIIETDLGQKSFTGQEIYNPSTQSGTGQGKFSNHSLTGVTTIAPSLSHVIFLGRIAQSLHDKFGLYLQFRKQINLSDKIYYNQSDGYYQDEELFDDPFSYESTGFASQLTWMLPWTTKLQINGEKTDKNYISEQAYLSAEDSIGLAGPRRDRQISLNFNLSKTFYIRKNWLNLLRINCYVSFIDNQSNSFWYHYKNAIYGAGVQWNF